MSTVGIFNDASLKASGIRRCSHRNALRPVRDVERTQSTSIMYLMAVYFSSSF